MKTKAKKQELMALQTGN